MCDKLYKLKRHLDQRTEEAKAVIKQCESARKAIDEFEKRYSVDSVLAIAGEPILLKGYVDKVTKVSPTEALRKIISSNPNKEWLHVELEAEIEDMIASGLLDVLEGRKPSLIVYSSMHRLIKNKEVIKTKIGNEKPRYRWAF